MKRIIGYLRPWVLWILVALGLLYVQANLDLALPDYMSRIVNTGIQQGGIESLQPEAIPERQVPLLGAFLAPGEAEAFLQGYVTLQPSDASGDLVARYPLLKTGAARVRIDIARPGEAVPAQGVDDDTLSRALAGMMVVDSIRSGKDIGFSGLGDGGFKLPAPAAAATGDAPASGDSPEPAVPSLDDPSVLKGMVAGLQARLEGLDSLILRQAGMAGLRSMYGTLGMDLEGIEIAYLFRVGGMMLLLTILSALITIAVGWIAARTAAGLAKALRRDAFARVESFSLAEFDRFSTASLITRVTNDVTQVQMVVFMFLRMVIYAPMMGVGGVVRAVGKAPSMAWLIALAVTILLLFIAVTFTLAMPKFRSIQKLVDRLNLVARENLSGILVIRAFNRQDFEQDRFGKANTDLTRVNRFVQRLMSLTMPAVMLIMNLMSVAIIWVGAHEIAASTMQVGDMMAFLQYAIQIVFSFMMLSMVMIFLPRAAVSADRIAEVLDTEPVIKDPAVPVVLPAGASGKLEFRNVAFRYHGGEEDALSDISFTAEPGKTTAIIGSTGSGKSTLVNLIPRLYDVTAGQVLLDGVDIRQLRQSDLRERIGYVPQKNTLFTGTIRSNLAYGQPDADDETLAQAADTACATEFIQGREDGLDADIAQGGHNVSGGQKQRLSIARALTGNRQILIFDDSFSALDYRTDGDVRKRLGERTGNATLLIVAQRVATIMGAHQILVLDDGQIVGRGTHSELMESCGAYREIARSQLGLEEEA